MASFFYARTRFFCFGDLRWSRSYIFNIVKKLFIFNFLTRNYRTSSDRKRYSTFVDRIHADAHDSNYCGVAHG